MKTHQIILFTLVSLSLSVHADWTVDFSRRQNDLKKMEMEALRNKEENKNPLQQVLEQEIPKEEVVIANTEKGFVPSTLRLKKDQTYQLTVVNVNKKKKNVSFMLDAFGEHHGTYFGDVISFEVRPQKEGMFQYVCPETETVGKVIVYKTEEGIAPVPAIKIRQPASDDNQELVPVRVDYE